MSGWEFYVQAFISVFILIDPITRGIFFRTLTENEPEKRPQLVRTLTITVGVLLIGSALIGKEVLDLLGINLGAFGIAGGFVLTLMGFEMLFGGEPSRTQGGEEAHEEPPPMSAEESIVVPYAIPFMAGPGAITTVITISASGSGNTGVWAALIACVCAVALIPVGHLWLVNKMNFSAQTMKLVTKFGGLFIATIGVQLMLGGIKTFFEI